MEAIKKIASVKNNTLVIPGLNSVNNKKVEVIILPLTESDKDMISNNAYTLHGKVTKYEDPFEPAVPENDWEAS